MTEHAVVIAGGGPTGLMLAAELALAKVDVVVVERRPTQELAGSRAGGFHARSLEVLDQRGVAQRFVSEGQRGPNTSFAWIPIDLSALPTRFPFVLALWQNKIERILAAWVEELGVPVLHGQEVTGFAQADDGIDVHLADGATLRARYLIGCDGGRSAIRKAAGIDFPGWEPTTSHLIAEALFRDEPELGMRRDASGIHGLSFMDDGVTVRIMLTETDTSRSGDPTLEELRERLVAIYGRDFGVHSPTWLSRFSDAARQAETYRTGRVLLAGDAAHIHYPVGGQGLNLGIQDAVNLGWKLGQVVQGDSPQSLLDTYHAERHPVAATVLRNTMAQVALLRSDDQTTALREVTAELLALDEPRARFGAMITGLDIRYDLGEGHPLLGRRMPDLDLEIDGEARRVFELMREGRPLLLDFGSAADLDIAPWGSRVSKIRAGVVGDWKLPVLGKVDAPAAVLVRPDGYVAWVGDDSDAGLRTALTAWFGVP